LRGLLALCVPVAWVVLVVFAVVAISQSPEGVPQGSNGERCGLRSHLYGYNVLKKFQKKKRASLPVGCH